MYLRTRGAVALLLVYTSLLAGAAVRAETVPAERRLPKSVVAYVSFRNVSELKAQWPQTALGKLSEDESLAEVRAALHEKFAETSRELEGQTGLTLNDLLSIPQGELAAAVVAQPDGKFQILLLLDFGTHGEAVQKLLAKLTERLENEGNTERLEDEYDDTKLILFKRRPAEEGDDAANGAVRLTEPSGYFVKESYIVVGSSADALKSVLTRWDGKHDDTFAENDVFQYVANTCRDAESDTPPLVTWFIDPLNLVRAGIAAQPQAAPQFNIMLGVLPAIGVDRFKGLGGTFDMGRGEFDMISRSLVYFEPPVGGLLNIAQFDESSQTPPKWVSAESSSYFAINWNLTKAYLGVESVVDMFQGPGALSRLLDQFAQNEATGHVHIKKDVLDLLSGHLHVVSEATGTDEEPDTDYLIAAELKNAGAARNTVRKLTQLPGIQIKEREFQGETIFELQQGTDEEAESMGLSVTENQLIFATNVKLIEHVLRGSDGRTPLAESPAFQRLAKRFPERTASIGFSRQDDDLKTLLFALKSGGLNQILGENADAIISRFPSYDSLKKFLTPSGSFMQATERGLKFTSFSLSRNAE